MNCGQPCPRRRIQAFAATPPDLLICRADVEHRMLGGIGDPEYFPDIFRNLPEAFVAAAQLRFHQLAFGNIARDYDDDMSLAGRHRTTEQFDGQWRSVLAPVVHLECPHAGITRDYPVVERFEFLA